MSHDCAITINKQTCLHCGHVSEFTTYIVRTGSNSFNYDVGSFSELKVTTLFTYPDYKVPRCIRCVDRGLKPEWPPYTGPHTNPDIPFTPKPKNFTRWRTSTPTKPSKPAFDPLALLPSLIQKSEPACPSTPAAPTAVSVATSFLPPAPPSPSLPHPPSTPSSSADATLQPPPPEPSDPTTGVENGNLP